MKSVILSERTKPRALESMKDIYAAHSAVCNQGITCRVMVKLKAAIDEAETPEIKKAHKARSVGVK
jgi:hypothetical protein